MAPFLSIIIPVLNEQDTICHTLSGLKPFRAKQDAEILVVDGDKDGGTLSVIDMPGVTKLLAEKGRGSQMNAGASAARGEILLFLHADTRLPENALSRILEMRDAPSLAAGAFDLGIASEHRAYRLIEKTASLRSRVTRLPYGDQALFIKRTWFDKIGGFAPIPLMEDLDLMLRLKRAGGVIRIFPDRVKTSARRWEKEGILACTLRNWMLLALFHTGVDPRKLAALYP